MADKLLYKSVLTATVSEDQLISAVPLVEL